jgi:hypothetical protein
MTTLLSEFSPVLRQSGLWSAQRGDLRCTAVRLRDGSLCLYSPVLGLGDIARESLASLGEVSILLAPNHYHNKGLAEYAEAFPNAKLVSSEGARPRLESQTGLSFEGLHQLDSRLPDDWNSALPDGLKTGEVWLALGTPEGLFWIVCDAFKGPSGKAGSVSSQIGMLGTFPTFGIKDKTTYKAWVEAKLKATPPKVVVPCHGSIVRSESLGSDIRSLLD